MRAMLLSVCVLLAPASARSADPPELKTKAEAALKRAVHFFADTVSTEGGYLWRYSDDLSRREGEGKATATQVWVQAPGTPAVGRAILEAYRATGDKYYLTVAQKAGQCLVRGQLASGGWDYRIEFDPASRKKYAYRADGTAAGEGKKVPMNVTTLDDDNTQSAIRFLLELDHDLGGKDVAIHNCLTTALQTLLAVQYPNGAWPQRFSAPPDPAQFPVRKASYPETWSRTYPKLDYRSYYTFNDNTIADTIDTLFLAWHMTQDERYRKAAEKGGDFILLAQMPDPQPAWAQQYDAEMRPAWARKFEPPAVTGGESQGIIRMLMKLYTETGDRRFLAPIPKALDYLERSVLPGGQLARFYELKTNRPLYFTKDYVLTESDADMPTHYGFKVGSTVGQLRQQYQRLSTAGAPPTREAKPAKRAKPKNAGDVERVIAAMDEQGRWVEKGKLRYHGADDTTERVIDCHTFLVNVRVLTKYLAQFQP